jgi:hypothetical protein
MFVEAKNEPKFGRGTEMAGLKYAWELDSGARGKEFEKEGFRVSSMLDRHRD